MHLQQLDVNLLESEYAWHPGCGIVLAALCRIIHWGSRGRKGYHTPRISMSFGCADPAYEPPYLLPPHLCPPAATAANGSTHAAGSGAAAAPVGQGQGRDSHLPFPDVSLRVALASAQMIIYHERFDLSEQQLTLFYKARREGGVPWLGCPLPVCLDRRWRGWGGTPL